MRQLFAILETSETADCLQDIRIQVVLTGHDVCLHDGHHGKFQFQLATPTTSRAGHYPSVAVDLGQLVFNDQIVFNRGNISKSTHTFALKRTERLLPHGEISYCIGFCFLCRSFATDYNGKCSLERKVRGGGCRQ